MTLKLDHVIIAVDDLDQAVSDYRALGFTTIYGGRHASGATHNALICFQDGTYLELLAPTGDSAQPGAVDFSPLLQHGEGLVGYALLSHDLLADAEALRARGAQIGEVGEGRRLRKDGIELRWRTAELDGVKSPFLIEDVTPRKLRVPDDIDTVTHSNGVTGVARLEGADYDSTRGNQHLTGLILAAPKLIAFDAERAHNVKLIAE
ncbi:MAG TPA: VOC family protein [Candidatus Saccharimonadales bacterium]|nr:VOC family protein [Candidatus Saccharimonadales bacterium]